MLTITQAQREAFSRAAFRRFEDWMASHLREFFPVQCGVLGEIRTREMILYGIMRAASFDPRLSG